MFNIDFTNKKNLIKAKAHFRSLGITIDADEMKTGGGGNWEFASDKQVESVLQEPLKTYTLSNPIKSIRF
jgi:hypothetical protein